MKAGRFFCCAFLLSAVPAYSDNEKLKAHDPEPIERAMASDKAAAARAQADSARPSYHFLPMANWMNDPNGPIQHNGYYHMFYQHNPYGDGWGHMHWGHARSKDLVHWEHLPIALWPSMEAGEEHIFSGCSAIRADGKPVIIYTSIKQGKSATDFAEQWLAVGDDDLIRWEKPKSNPALSDSLHGDKKIWDWRDPFLFNYQGDDYLVLGGNLNHGKGGEGVVNLYKAKDSTLMNWEYVGVLFEHPDPKVGNIECPNFFELNGKWMLVISPHRRVEYFIGSFDGKKFTAEKQGLMDESDNYYAPNCTTDDKGRRLMWGWIRGFKGDQGWNGCLTLPRELRIDEHGQLWQRAVNEMSALRGEKLFEAKDLALEGSKKVRCKTPQFEITASFVSGNDSGIRILKSDGKPGFDIFYSNGELKVGGQTSALQLGPNDPLDLHVFVDHSVIEVYANGKSCTTKVQEMPLKDVEIEFYSREKNSSLNGAVYELNGIW